MKKTAINSKQKGSAGERELALKLREYGYDARRSVQYNGREGQADVVGLPFLHAEVKRVEKLNLYKAMEQAGRDAKNGDRPTVFHRRNRGKWLVTMELERFMELYTGFLENGKSAEKNPGEGRGNHG